MEEKCWILLLRILWKKSPASRKKICPGKFFQKKLWTNHQKCLKMPLLHTNDPTLMDDG
jgi:hypothetical protein